MKIRCGKDFIDIAKVTEIYIGRDKEDLADYEKKLNGDFPRFPCVFNNNNKSDAHSNLRKLIEDTLNERWHIVISRIQHFKPFLQEYGKSGSYAKATFSVSTFDADGNAYVKCKFIVKYDDGLSKNSFFKRFYEKDYQYEETLTLAQDILPIFKKIADQNNPSKKKSLFGEKVLGLIEGALEVLSDPTSVLSDKSTSQESTEDSACAIVAGSPSSLQISNVYSEYQSVFSQNTPISQGRIAQREQFLKDHKDRYLLVIKTARSKKIYMEDICGFDIWEKEEELQNAFEEYQHKVENSNNPGEKAVEYAIKWFLASGVNNVVSIKGDCESRHRYDCIQLTNSAFIDEPQEYDHVLVCPAGVVLLETKHWKGSVEIREDGKWLRKEDTDTPVHGVDSPKFQMRRHEMLMQSILPNVNIHSILCFSNPSIIIDGRENFKDYPIILIDQLEETLTALCTDGTYAKDEIDKMVATIESHKLLRYEGG